MAAADPVRSIKDQFTCAICLDIFRDPVTTDCGHSFCKECITQHCKEEHINVACPLCKKIFQMRNLRRNRELKNLVEAIPHLLGSQMVGKPVERNVCKRHQEPLKFYCREDQIPICVVCERSQAHRNHFVIPMEEAVQEHRETITEKLRVIESNFEKLHLFVNQVWKHFPRCAQEEERKRLKTLIDKVATLFKVESQRKRFKDCASQTQPPESDLTSFNSERKTDMETELKECEERENIPEKVSGKKEETVSHVIHICEEAPTPKYGLDQTSLDPTVHSISNITKDAEHKVDVKSSGRRYEEPNPSVEPGVRKKNSISPGGNVATQMELQGCEGKGEQVSEEQKHDSPCNQKDAESPIVTVSLTDSGEYKQAHVTSLSISLQDLTSLNTAMESGDSRNDSISPGENVALKSELQSCEEGGRQISAEQKDALICAHQEAETSVFMESGTGPPSETCKRKQAAVKYKTKSLQDLTCVKATMEFDGSRNENISPADNVAAQTEFQGCEEKGGKMPNKGKESTSDEHTLSRSRHLSGRVMEHIQADVKPLKKDLQDVTSPNTTMESGSSRHESISPGGNVSLQPEFQACEEKKRQVSEEQKEATTCVHKEAETPVCMKRDGSQAPSQMCKQVDEKPLFSKRLQNLEYVKAVMEPGRKRKGRIPLRRNVTMPIELQGCEVDVTLDPATAHPRLILSEDRKSMIYGDKQQDLPNNLERFNVSVSALGSESFTSGRHYWEVEAEIGHEKYWAIGVSKDSVKRKGRIDITSRAGIWALASFGVSRHLKKGLVNIGIYLDYEKGEVRFYNAEDMTEIYSFTTTFTGKLVPFFHIWSKGSSIKLSPCWRH